MNFIFAASIAAIPKVIVDGDQPTRLHESFPFAPVSYEPRIELEDYPGLSVLIPIATNTYKASAREVFMELMHPGNLNYFRSKNDFIGIKFTVVAPKGFRIMATVQAMNLLSNDFNCEDKQFLQVLLL